MRAETGILYFMSTEALNDSIGSGLRPTSTSNCNSKLRLFPVLLAHQLIGSFQLAIIMPWINFIGYDTATVQS